MSIIQQFLDSKKYFELYADDALFQEYIQRLTVEGVLQIVTTLNRFLRNKENEEVIVDNMFAGELAAPPSIIRNIIIANYLKTLKELNDNKLRAELTYYTFINLHLFEDGNGRTSRLLYGLISGEIEDDAWYIHSDVQSNSKGDFCSYKGMLDESEINQLTESSEIIKQHVDKYPLLENIGMYKTYYNGIEMTPVDEIISPTVLNQLTDDEKKYIFSIINDNEGCYSIAGLAMLLVTMQNKQLKSWLIRKKEFISSNRRLSFNLKKDKDLLMAWTIDDWKNLIRVGCELKCKKFDHLNQVFIERKNIHQKK